MTTMPEIVTAAQMLALVQCGIYGSIKDRAEPNEVVLSIYGWDAKLLEWRKIPRSGGKMAVKAVENE